MVAYYFTGKKDGQKVHELYIANQPGALATAEKIVVSSKREANQICKTRNVQPQNF